MIKPGYCYDDSQKWGYIVVLQHGDSRRIGGTQNPNSYIREYQYKIDGVEECGIFYHPDYRTKLKELRSRGFGGWFDSSGEEVCYD